MGAPPRPTRHNAKAAVVAVFCLLYLLHVAGTGGRLFKWQGQGGGNSGRPAARRRQLIETPVEENKDLHQSGTGGSDEDMAALLSREAVVRGFTPKAGPTRLYYWTAANRTARHEAFTRWVDETMEHPDSPLAADTSGDVRLPRLQPLYPNCQILVNHRYKVIYLRHPKSASSSVTMYFTLCPAKPQPKQQGGGGAAAAAANAGSAAAAGGGSGGDAATAAETAAAGSAESAAATAGAQQRRRALLGEEHGQQQGLGKGAACLEPLTTAELPPEELRRLWAEYFVFTVVRNPFQRLLSSYKYLLRKTRARPSCKMVRWSDFCQDPLALGRMCLAAPDCCPLPAGFFFHHVIDQGRCLETEEGDWATDYVVTVENFEEGMREVVAEIDRRRAPGLPPLAEVAGELTHQNEARGAGAKAACTLPNNLDELVPERTRVLTPSRGWVAYNATVLLDRYCDPADYFRGPHSRCLMQARHFYATDLRRLYGEGAAAAQPEDQQLGAVEAGLEQQGELPPEAQQAA